MKFYQFPDPNSAPVFVLAQNRGNYPNMIHKCQNFLQHHPMHYFAFVSKVYILTTATCNITDNHDFKHLEQLYKDTCILSVRCITQVTQ